MIVFLLVNEMVIFLVGLCGLLFWVCGSFMFILLDLFRDSVNNMNVVRRKNIMLISGMILICVFLGLLGELFEELFVIGERDEGLVKECFGC